MLNLRVFQGFPATCSAGDGNLHFQPKWQQPSLGRNKEEKGMLIPFPTQDTELRAPGVPSKSLRTTWGCTRQILNPSLGLGVPHWGAQGKFPQPRHIQQLPFPPNPGMGGTPIPGHPWKATRHHIPCSAPSSLAGPTYPCSSPQHKFCFVRGFGLGFVLFFLFFLILCLKLYIVPKFPCFMSLFVTVFESWHIFVQLKIYLHYLLNKDYSC